MFQLILFVFMLSFSIDTHRRAFGATAWATNLYTLCCHERKAAANTLTPQTWFSSESLEHPKTLQNTLQTAYPQDSLDFSASFVIWDFLSISPLVEASFFLVGGTVLPKLNVSWAPRGSKTSRRKIKTHGSIGERVGGFEGADHTARLSMCHSGVSNGSKVIKFRAEESSFSWCFEDTVVSTF